MNIKVKLTITCPLLLVCIDRGGGVVVGVKLTFQDLAYIYTLFAKILLSLSLSLSRHLVTILIVVYLCIYVRRCDIIINPPLGIEQMRQLI